MTESAHAAATEKYAGEERRQSLRMQATYPARIRFDCSGEMLEWYSRTCNVSSDGVLITALDTLEPGTEARLSIAVPIEPATSFPTVQLDGPAAVVRCERGEETEGCSRRIALRFLQNLTLSTGLSMYE